MYKEVLRYIFAFSLAVFYTGLAFAQKSSGSWLPDYISSGQDSEANVDDPILNRNATYSAVSSIGYQTIQVLDVSEALANGFYADVMSRLEQRKRLSNNLFGEAGFSYFSLSGKDIGPDRKKYTVSSNMLSAKLAVGMQMNFDEPPKTPSAPVVEGVQLYLGLTYEYGISGSLKLTGAEAGAKPGGTYKLTSAHRIGASGQALYPIVRGLYLGGGADFFLGTYRVRVNNVQRTTYSGTNWLGTLSWRF